MTFSCPRLSCTVCRHAGPCARKMSATSGTEVLRVLCVVQILQRTDHLTQQISSDLCIKCGGLQLLVSEQDLDHTDIDLLFEQVGCKAVAPMSPTT